MIKWAMGGMFLALLARNTSKVIVGLRDDFGKELCLVGRKGSECKWMLERVELPTARKAAISR